MYQRGLISPCFALQNKPVIQTLCGAMRWFSSFLCLYILSFPFGVVAGYATVSGIIEFFLKPSIVDHIFTTLLTATATTFAYGLTRYIYRRSHTLKFQYFVPVTVAISCAILFPMLFYLAQLVTIT